MQVFSFVALTFTIYEIVHVLDTEVRTTSLPIVLTERVSGGGGALLTPGLNVGATCLLEHVGSLPVECAQISARIQS